jgi:uncharacterized protein YacL
MKWFKRESKFVLDSSSIIDGRVIHLFDKKIFEGRIIIPDLVKFIVKRFIGPRCETAINVLKRNATVEFVDVKGNGLVEEECVLKVAQRKRAKVITTSDEVRRHAQLFPKVKILDIRDLYRLLTPIFIPNKLISVRILKRGLNHTEGVGYIEGVKIVVENGAKYINQTISARVTTMLAFETGNLVFCVLAGDEGKKTTAERKAVTGGGRVDGQHRRSS